MKIAIALITLPIKNYIIFKSKFSAASILSILVQPQNGSNGINYTFYTHL